MKRWIKVTYISLICLAGLAVAAFGLWLLALQQAFEGGWPFQPLEHWHSEIEVSTGGRILLDGVEQRGFRSNGFSIHASYRPLEGATLEPFGSWSGYYQDPKVYTVGSLLVVLSPNQTAVYVRTGDRQWNDFHMDFPSEGTELPLSFYSHATGLSEDELRQIRSDITEDERHWAPTVRLQSFDPATRTITVRYDTNMTTHRDLSLRLSADGTALHLADVRKVTGS